MSARVIHIRRLPRFRAECENGPRPCPHSTCKHHLGSSSSDESCVLDVAARGETSTRDIARLLGLSHGRVQQIENSVLRKLHRAGVMVEFLERPSGVRLTSHKAAHKKNEAEDDEEVDEFDAVEEVEDPWAAAAWRAIQRRADG